MPNGDLDFEEKPRRGALEMLEKEQQGVTPPPGQQAPPPQAPPPQKTVKRPEFQDVAQKARQNIAAAEEEATKDDPVLPEEAEADKGLQSMMDEWGKTGDISQVKMPEVKKKPEEVTKVEAEPVTKGATVKEEVAEAPQEPVVEAEPEAKPAPKPETEPKPTPKPEPEPEPIPETPPPTAEPKAEEPTQAPAAEVRSPAERMQALKQKEEKKPAPPPKVEMPPVDESASSGESANPDIPEL